MTDPATPQLDDHLPRHGDAVRYRDRSLVDAFLSLDSIDAQSTRSPELERKLRASTMPLESKLVSVATSFPQAAELQRSLREVRSTVSVVAAGAVLIAFVSGAGAARAALGAPRGEAVNFYFVLAALLGVQSLLLVVWFVIAAAHSHRESMLRNLSLGGLILRLARWAGGRLHRSSFHAASASAVAAELTTGSLGRWTLGSISHGLWTAFNVGCLLMVIALLSAKQYAFVWETTILSPQAYVPLTRTIAVVPELFGFPAPQVEQIEASRWMDPNAQTPEVSQAWSGLLVGSLVCYGFGPRILLLGYCLGRRRLAKSNYRLDESRPEVVRWRQRLMAEAEVQPPASTGSIEVFHEAPLDAVDPRPIGPPAILAVELQLPKGLPSWPPPAHDVRWTDLGFIETRDDQKRVIGILKSADERPAAVVIVCSLLTAPDRGVRTLLEELRSATSAPLRLVLTGGQALRQRARGEAISQRIDDWRSLAAQAGAASSGVIELDLDHYTHASAAQLASAVGGVPGGRATSHLEEAFELIERFAERSNAGGSLDREAASLHAEITRLYRDSGDGMRQLLGLPRSLDVGSMSQLGDQMRAGAQRMIDQLPARMRGSYRWLVAGAAAGALGCIAAASLISPVAISALPAWSALGSAISAAIKLHRAAALVHDAVEEPDEAFDRTIRSAALMSLVLELQGRGEKTITRVLDQTLGEMGAEAPLRQEDVSSWLADVRGRFHSAVSAEARA